MEDEYEERAKLEADERRCAVITTERREETPDAGRTDDHTVTRTEEEARRAERADEDVPSPEGDTGRHCPTMRACISEGDDDGRSASGAKSRPVMTHGRARWTRDRRTTGALGGCVLFVI